MGSAGGGFRRRGACAVLDVGPTDRRARPPVPTRLCAPDRGPGSVPRSGPGDLPELTRLPGPRCRVLGQAANRARLHSAVRGSLPGGASPHGSIRAGGNGGRFWSLILPHGILELMASCISAGAGLRMGWSLVDPGDRTRGRALQEEAAESVVVVIGVIPAFVVAALIEGFVTGTALPDAVEIGIGVAASVGYLLWLVTSGRRGRRLAT